MFPELHSIDKPILFKNLFGRKMQTEIEIAITMTERRFLHKSTMYFGNLFYSNFSTTRVLFLGSNEIVTFYRT